ncbi:MAG: chemotaxis protein CheD [bacterium]|nr:chemotaxis protein CheD [bacterium]
MRKSGRMVVGVADMAISDDAADSIITHALGSCLGITIFDPVVNVGGMLHVMLPQSSIDPVKAAKNPAMFVDTGVPRLFKECYKLGAQKERLIIKVAGGAKITLHGNNDEDDDDIFKVGKRNFVMLRKLLWKNGVLIKAHDVGGSMSRTMELKIEDGGVVITNKGNKSSL